LGDNREAFDFKADLADHSVGDANGYVAKVWATRRIGELIDEIDLHGQNSELVNELVELSKRHGIMTPYTSFLADERVNNTDRDAAQSRATQSLESLTAQQAGEKAVTERQFKGNLQAASRPAPTWTGTDITDAKSQRFGAPGGREGGRGPAPDDGVFLRNSGGGMGGGGMGGGMGGGGGMRDSNKDVGEPAQTANPLAPASGMGYIGKTRRERSRQRNSAPVEVTAPKNPVQTIGDKTFYWKNDRWRDSDVTAEGEKHPIKITAFSSQYFALASKGDSQFAKYLSLEGPILIALDGKTYLIEPAKNVD
jgi:Ca-activated chloride channel family protein